MNNVFNHKPSILGSRPTVKAQLFTIGNSLDGRGYDYLGRSLFVNVTRDF